MTSLFLIREQVKNFFGKYEAYLMPVVKLLTAMVVLLNINAKLGYMAQLDNLAIVMIAALFCSFMPMNFIVLIAALFTMLHLYKLSLECLIVIGALFLLILLLYFRFSPKDTLAMVLTPICFILHIPYLMPIAMGLLGIPTSVISVGCGVIIYYVISFVTKDTSAIVSMADAETTSKIKYLLDGVIENKTMIMTVIAFSAVLLVVYVVRRLSVDYAWTIAIGAGVLVSILSMLIGDIVWDINVSIVGVILGSIVSGLLALIVQFFNFTVDYKRTEKVQFEDDEYYYYVKAVPKISVTKPVKKVKKINPRKKHK